MEGFWVRLKLTETDHDVSGGPPVIGGVTEWDEAAADPCCGVRIHE